MTDFLHIPFLPEKKEAAIDRIAFNHYGTESGGRAIDLRQSGIAEVPVFGVSSWKKAPPANPPHRHDHLEICYLADGSRMNANASEIRQLVAGDLWINKPGVAHGSTICPCGASTIYYLEITQEESIAGLSPAESAAFWKHWLDLPVSVCRVGLGYAAIFEAIFKIIDSPDPLWREARLRTAVNALFFSALEHFHAAPRAMKQPGIDRVLDLIATTPPEKLLSLEELAETAGVSLSTFKVRFRAEVGIPPAQFLLRRRVAAAARVLLEGPENIVETANRFGFASSQHFATVFKAHTGETPMHYRQTRRRTDA